MANDVNIDGIKAKLTPAEQVILDEYILEQRKEAAMAALR